MCKWKADSVGDADPERLLRGAAAAGRGGHLAGPRRPPGPLRRLARAHRARRPRRLPRVLPPLHPQDQGPYLPQLGRCRSESSRSLVIYVEKLH